MIHININIVIQYPILLTYSKLRHNLLDTIITIAMMITHRHTCYVKTAVPYHSATSVPTNAYELSTKYIREYRNNRQTSNGHNFLTKSDRHIIITPSF